MRVQRLSAGRVPAIDARADQLPFDDNASDASMSLLSVHHWPDLPAGLREMRRVTRGPIVIMTYDPDGLDDFWNAHYFPELVAVERARYPKLDTIAAALAAQPRSSACRFRSIASTDSRKPSTPGPKPFCGRKSARRNRPGVSCRPGRKPCWSSASPPPSKTANGNAGSGTTAARRSLMGHCGWWLRVSNQLDTERSGAFHVFYLRTHENRRFVQLRRPAGAGAC